MLQEALQSLPHQVLLSTCLQELELKVKRDTPKTLNYLPVDLTYGVSVVSLDTFEGGTITTNYFPTTQKGLRFLLS